MTSKHLSIILQVAIVLLMIDANILTTNACWPFTKQQAQGQLANLLSLYPDLFQGNQMPYGNQQGFGQPGLNQFLRPNNGFNNGLQQQLPNNQQLPTGQQLPNGQQQQQLPINNPYGQQQGFGQQPNYNGQQPNYNGQQQLPYNQFTG